MDGRQKNIKKQLTMFFKSNYLDETSKRFNFLPKLPLPISWFLGYRNETKPVPEWIKLLSIFLCTMAGMLVNLAMIEHGPLYTNHWHFTTFIPSFAASCILIYGSIDAPFSQPRNLFFGHFISGLLGVCIMKLFMTNSNNEQYLWLSGALSVAVASVAMEITGTVHPPSGATAVLPSVNREVRNLGWNYLPALLIQSLLFLGVAMLCNNLTRRYPRYWVSPPSPPPAASAPPPEKKHPAQPTIVISETNIELPNSVYFSDEDYKLIKSLQAKLMMTP